MQIHIDDPLKPDILLLLQDHLADMAQHSPPGSVHALDPVALSAADITFWSAREHSLLMGCGALKALTPCHGEIKSMRTDLQYRGRGVARNILRAILTEADSRGCRRLSLETGSADVFAPARALYRKHGFAECEPFGDYDSDPHSIFMSRLV